MSLSEHTLQVPGATLHVERRGSGPTLGSSSGAIIALHLLVQHPEHVSSLVAHEPPLVDLLPDASDVQGFFRDVFATYRESGVPAAMQKFLAGIGIAQSPRPQGDVPAEMRPLFERMQRNQAFFFEHELRQFPSLTPDLDALTARRAQLVLGVGRDSVGTLPYRPNLVLAERFGVGVSEFAGGHVGFATHPTEFATRLAELLSERARNTP